MTNRKCYALAGTGGHAGMFVDAVTTTYEDAAELVAFFDSSQTRMQSYNDRLQNERGLVPLPTYFAGQFDQMVAETTPDTVTVSTVDATHHRYISRAMELGCDAVSEKPKTTDLPKLQAIFDTIEKTRTDVRAGTMGCTGHSGVGCTALWLSVVDKRVTAVVVSGYFNSFRDSSWR